MAICDTDCNFNYVFIYCFIIIYLFIVCQSARHLCVDRSAVDDLLSVSDRSVTEYYVSTSIAWIKWDCSHLINEVIVTCYNWKFVNSILFLNLGLSIFNTETFVDTHFLQLRFCKYDINLKKFLQHFSNFLWIFQVFYLISWFSGVGIIFYLL